MYHRPTSTLMTLTILPTCSTGSIERLRSAPSTEAHASRHSPPTVAKGRQRSQSRSGRECSLVHHPNNQTLPKTVGTNALPGHKVGLDRSLPMAAANGGYFASQTVKSVALAPRI